MTVTKGARAASPYCDGTCNYINLTTSGFQKRRYTCALYSDAGGEVGIIREYSFRGDFSGDLNYFYGYENTHVWAVCGGVESNHELW